jgi:hypothetical protein
MTSDAGNSACIGVARHVVARWAAARAENAAQSAESSDGCSA